MDVLFGVVLVAGLVGAVFGLSWLVDALWHRWNVWRSRRRRRLLIRRVSEWRGVIERQSAEAAMDRASAAADRREGAL